MITLETLPLAGLVLLTPQRFCDLRGAFSETYNKRGLAEVGIDLQFVQDNESVSTSAGTVRGLHFQIAPFAQDKLVRCVRGRILDVVVDVRRSSPTYGRHVSVELSPENAGQLLVPSGFAHGFCTLEPNCVVLYKTSNYYSPSHDKGVVWSDPELSIEWPVVPERAILSDKDRRLPLFRDLPAYFE